jgi:hypothetical protein
MTQSNSSNTKAIQIRDQFKAPRSPILERFILDTDQDAKTEIGKVKNKKQQVKNGNTSDKKTIVK